MIILNKIIKDKEILKNIEEETYFDDMIKCVVDVKREVLAINAELHSDLEELLLESGSDQHDLYGINILFDPWEVEYISVSMTVNLLIKFTLLRENSTNGIKSKAERT